MNIFSKVDVLSTNYENQFISDETLHDQNIEEEEEEHISKLHSTPLQPHTLLLKDGETTATMYPIPANPELLPVGLLAFLLDEFNMEIEKGDSFPYYEPLTLEQFKRVWFHDDGHICIMVLGEIPELDYSIENDLSDLENNYGMNIDTMRNSTYYKNRKRRRNINLNIQWEKQCLGLFSLNPAYPGRSSHVVTGSFLVNAGIRGKGIGKTLVETFNEWAQRLGFTSCYFPLIYSTSVGIRRILEVLNFRRIGKLPESGILKGFDVPVDSFIYGKEYTHITKGMDSLRDPQKTEDIAKYERLIYYLKAKKYPPYCDRNEKARLRVSSKTHYLLNGKLMTKGREIIFDPNKQKQIAMEMHMVEHQGINKITSKIVERYHWKGIKNTVCEVLAQCIKCKMRHLDGTGVVVMPNENVPRAHMLPGNSISSININHNQLNSIRITEEHNSKNNETNENIKYSNGKITNSTKESKSLSIENNDDIYETSTLSQMAAAAVRNLQNENGRDEIIEPTPPDTLNNSSILAYSNTVPISKYNNINISNDFERPELIERRDIPLQDEEEDDTTHEGDLEKPQGHVHERRHGHGDDHSKEQFDEEMNSFNRFVDEENERKRKRYLDVAEGAKLTNANKKVTNNNNNNKITDEIIDNAIKNLETDSLTAVKLLNRENKN